MLTKIMFYMLSLSILVLGLTTQSYGQARSLQEKLDELNDDIIGSQTTSFDYDSNYVVYVSENFHSLLDESVSVYLFKKKPEIDHFIAGDVLVMALGDSINYKFRLIDPGLIIGIRDSSGEKLFLVSNENVETFIGYMDFGINPYIRMGVPLMKDFLTDVHKASLVLGELFYKFVHQLK